MYGRRRLPQVRRFHNCGHRPFADVAKHSLWPTSGIGRTLGGHEMRRREFTAGLLGGTLTIAARSRLARAQQGRADRRVPASDVRGRLRASAGRPAPGDSRRPASSRVRTSRSKPAMPKVIATAPPTLAADLIKRQVAVIVTDQAVHDVKAATSSIPNSVRARRRSRRVRAREQPQPAGRQHLGRRVFLLSTRRQAHRPACARWCRAPRRSACWPSRSA